MVNHARRRWKYSYEKYFWRDMLHMNRSGYDVWAKNIKPLINKILE